MNQTENGNWIAICFPPLKSPYFLFPPAPLLHLMSEGLIPPARASLPPSDGTV